MGTTDEHPGSPFEFEVTAPPIEAVVASPSGLYLVYGTTMLYNWRLGVWVEPNGGKHDGQTRIHEESDRAARSGGGGWGV